MKWENPKKVLGRTIYDMIPSTGEMMDDFVRHGLIQNLSGNYHEDVYNMCRNGATWLAGHMSSIGLPVEVVEGTFDGQSHCWVVLEDYYFDTTIAQVDESFPEFACIQKVNAVGYSEFMRFPATKWFERHMV